MKLKSITLAAIAISAATMSTAYAGWAGEQVWEAVHTNTQQVCGIDANSGTASGQILTAGETGTDSGKAIEFKLKANTRNMTYKITEAKLVENTGRFDFADNLLTVGDAAKTSLFVNNQEINWTAANQDRSVDPKGKIRLAPKINLDATEMPVGTTKIQGKIVVTCSN